MKSEEVKVLVLGAGLTGLSVAYELEKFGVSYKIIEKSSRLGGVIHTSQTQSFLYENGPNTGIIGSPELAVMLDELKDDLILQTGDEAVKRRLILKNGKWAALPSGLISAVKTPLFSWKDKFRILGEPFRRKGTNPEETLDQLVLRRMGKSFLEYAIDPFILGVYAGDPAQLVTRYAFPKLYNLEQNYGSFIGGSLKKSKIPKTAAEKKATREVFSFAGGLEDLTRTLTKKLQSANILKGVGEVQIQKEPSGYRMTGHSPEGEWNLSAPVLISTLNAKNLSRDLLPFVPNSLLEAVRVVQYAPTVEVVLGFEKWTGMKLQAFGGLIPHCENRQLLGILFLSAFLPNRAPEGGALLTLFMGGVRNPVWIHKSDEEIRETVEKEVRELLQLTDFKPDLFEIIRHPGAIPQYSFESGEKLRAIQTIQDQFPGFLLGGNVVDGIGIADRVKQGVNLAAKAVQILNEREK